MYVHVCVYECVVHVCTDVCVVCLRLVHVRKGRRSQYQKLASEQGLKAKGFYEDYHLSLVTEQDISHRAPVSSYVAIYRTGCVTLNLCDSYVRGSMVYVA